MVQPDQTSTHLIWVQVELSAAPTASAIGQVPRDVMSQTRSACVNSHIKGETAASAKQDISLTQELVNATWEEVHALTTEAVKTAMDMALALCRDQTLSANATKDSRMMVLRNVANVLTHSFLIQIVKQETGLLKSQMSTARTLSPSCQRNFGSKEHPKLLLLFKLMRVKSIGHQNIVSGI